MKVAALLLLCVALAGAKSFGKSSSRRSLFGMHGKRQTVTDPTTATAGQEYTGREPTYQMLLEFMPNILWQLCHDELSMEEKYNIMKDEFGQNAEIYDFPGLDELAWTVNHHQCDNLGLCVDMNDPNAMQWVFDFMGTQFCNTEFPMDGIYNFFEYMPNVFQYGDVHEFALRVGELEYPPLDEEGNVIPDFFFNNFYDVLCRESIFNEPWHYQEILHSMMDLISKVASRSNPDFGRPSPNSMIMNLENGMHMMKEEEDRAMWEFTEDEGEKIEGIRYCVNEILTATDQLDILLDKVEYTESPNYVPHEGFVYTIRDNVCVEEMRDNAGYVLIAMYGQMQGGPAYDYVWSLKDQGIINLIFNMLVLKWTGIN